MKKSNKKIWAGIYITIGILGSLWGYPAATTEAEQITRGIASTIMLVGGLIVFYMPSDKEQG